MIISEIAKRHWLLKIIILGIITAIIWLGVNYLMRHIFVPQKYLDKSKFRKELFYDSLFTTCVLFISLCIKDITFKILNIE